MTYFCRPNSWLLRWKPTTSFWNLNCAEEHIFIRVLSWFVDILKICKPNFGSSSHTLLWTTLLLHNTHLSEAHVAVHLTAGWLPNQTQEREAAHWPSHSRWLTLDLQTTAHWRLTWGYAKEQKTNMRGYWSWGQNWVGCESGRTWDTFIRYSFPLWRSFISLPRRLTTASMRSHIKKNIEHVTQSD